jgi:hypothetical protein
MQALYSLFVMPALVAASASSADDEDVDGRNKSGHDGWGELEQPLGVCQGWQAGRSRRILIA